MKNRCETCPTIGHCKKAFGRYWADRSHGGVGCDLRFRYIEAAPAADASRSEVKATTQEDLI